MPFDIGDTINQFADAFLRAPVVSSVVKNPIYTSIVLTFIIILIILFIFREVETDESLLILGARASFLIFTFMTGILFLHNKVLISESTHTTANSDYEKVFSAQTHEPTLEDSVVPVVLQEQPIIF